MVSLIERPVTVPSPDAVLTPKQLTQLRLSSLFSQYQETRRVDIRDELIRMNLGIVRFVVARFAARGESFEDLYQVGCIGLLKAVERFQPERGFAFLTFAVPTISGEIQRYFRDLKWTLRIPRLLQSRWLACDTAVDALTKKHGRSPTVAEIAALVGITEERVLEAQEARQSRMVASIDALETADRDNYRATISLGRIDPNLAAVDDKLSAKALLQGLSEPDRLLVGLRFGQQMSQRLIAQVLGVSQMQVCRRLVLALDKLRLLYGREMGSDFSHQRRASRVLA